MIVKTQQEKKCYKNSFPEEKINKEFSIKKTKVSRGRSFVEKKI